MFRRPLMLLFVIILGAVAVGLLAIGAFPPPVTPQAVERPLPNDRFQSSR